MFCVNQQMIIWQAGYTERCTSGLEGSLRETCMREHNKAPERLPYPIFYYKKEIRLQCKEIHSGRRRTVTAFVYIMDETRPLGRPTDRYVWVCEEGYRYFGFDLSFLKEALRKSSQA